MTLNLINIFWDFIGRWSDHDEDCWSRDGEECNCGFIEAFDELYAEAEDDDSN